MDFETYYKEKADVHFVKSSDMEAIAVNKGQRDEIFGAVALQINVYFKHYSISKDEVFHYLGQPDLVAKSFFTVFSVIPLKLYFKTEKYIYFYTQQETEMCACLTFSRNKLVSMGYNNTSVNDHSEYKKYNKN